MAAALLQVPYVFQDFRLLKDRNVYENVAFAQRIIQVSNKEIKRNVPSILATVGLAGKYKAKPKQLSGGEQQRVNAARAFSNGSAKIILLDEPTASLDKEHAEQLMKYIRNSRATVIYTTHREEDAAFADKVVNLC